MLSDYFQAFISTGRLSKFLSCTEYTSQLKLHSTEHLHNIIPKGEMAVVFSEADCVWSSSKDIERDIFLKKISLDLPKGFFIVVIGEVIFPKCFFFAFFFFIFIVIHLFLIKIYTMFV